MPIPNMYHVTIENLLNETLTLKNYDKNFWAIAPPISISPHSTTGSFNYKPLDTMVSLVKYRVEFLGVPDADKPVVTLEFSIVMEEDDGGATACHRRKIYANPDSKLLKLKKDKMNMKIDYNYKIFTNTSISSIRIPLPTLNVYNSKDELFNNRDEELWTGAHPTKYEDDTFRGSNRPVSTALNEPMLLNVIMNVDENLIGVPFALHGDLWDTDKDIIANTTSACFYSTGKHTVQVAVKPKWIVKDFPWGIAGDITWRIITGSTGQEISLNSTRLEVYSLTTKLPKFFENRLNVNLLRIVVLPARQTHKNPDWTSYVINSAFQNFGFKYNTAGSGQARFIFNGTGGYFHLSDWVQKAHHNYTVNCYDQAGIVQIALGLNGQASEWIFMQPYGFIHTTHLVGIAGKVNNPYYAEGPDPQHCIGPAQLEKQQPFRNHVFVRVNGKIADACAGPHLATQDLRQYLGAAIIGLDQTDYFYKKKKYGHINQGEVFDKPGSVDDAMPKLGVTSLIDPSQVPPLSDKDLEHTKPLMKAAATKQVAASYVNPKLPAIDDLMLFEKRSVHGRGILHRSHTISPVGSHISWITDLDHTELGLSICTSSESARNQLQRYLLSHSRPINEVYIPASDDVHQGDICLTSPPESDNHIRILWVRGNAFAHVSTSGMSLKALHTAYAKPIDRLLEGEVLGKEVLKPIVNMIDIPKSVKVGQEFTAQISVKDCKHSTVYTGNNDVIVLLSANTPLHSFHFRAGKIGKETLRFIFAHSTTGMVVTREIEVSVVG